jgi:hypothetical protein
MAGLLSHNGDGYGCGDGSGCGDGYGDGYGCGDGCGYGSGSGDGDPIGEVGGYSVTRAPGPWPVVRVGCEVHTLERWRERWREIADEQNVTITAEQVERLLAAAEQELSTCLTGAFGRLTD